MGTFIVVSLLIISIGIVICSMVRDKRKGKSLQCGGDCKNCHGGCH